METFAVSNVIESNGAWLPALKLRNLIVSPGANGDGGYVLHPMVTPSVG
jgi:hypothetical protein